MADHGAAGPPAPAAVVAYCTVPNAEVGSALARALVLSKLAACVNIVPGVRSVYQWKGEVCEDDELLLIIKTRAELTGARRRAHMYGRALRRLALLAGQLEEAVRALHPYDTPELIALPIAAGAAPYLSWLHGSTDGGNVAAALAKRGAPLRE